MKRNENGKTKGNILSICYTTYRSSNDRKATVQRCFERSPGGREKRKLRRCQRTKDSKCTHILLVRTSNPSSLFYLFPPTLLSLSLFISIYSLFSIFHVYCHPLSVSWVCVKRSFRCCAAFRQSTSSIYIGLPP